MHKFKELKVWERSVKLSKTIYQLTKGFPDSERFGLVSQLNRCSVSIPSNIAEGAGRNTAGEFKQFLGISIGSLYEMETQLIISNEIGLISQNSLEIISNEIEEINKMLIGLIKSLSTKKGV